MNQKILIIIILTTIFHSSLQGQGLFESALSGSGTSSDPENLSLGGFIRSVAYAGNTPGEDDPYLQSLYAQAALTLETAPKSWARARAEIRFRQGSEFGREISELDLREAYLELFSSSAGLRIGRLISPWGKGTMFNPTGKLTPMDPTVRSPVADDRYLGTWGTEGYMHFGNNHRFTAHWRPLFRPSTLLIEPVPMPDYVQFADPRFPGLELREGSYGLNYEFFSSVMDGSLYWFQGYHHWPGIMLESFSLNGENMLPESLELRQRAYRIRMAGADLSVPVRSWIIRAEGAWQQTRRSRGDQEYLPFPEVSYVAEIERGSQWWTLVAGYYGKYILDFYEASAPPSLSADEEMINSTSGNGMMPSPGMLEQAFRDRVAAFNRLYNYQLREYYHTAFLSFRGSWLGERLELELPATFNLTTGEWMIRPVLALKPGNGMIFSAGYHGMFAPGGELYDLVGPVLNAAWLSAQFSF